MGRRLPELIDEVCPKLSEDRSRIWSGRILMVDRLLAACTLSSSSLSSPSLSPVVVPPTVPSKLLTPKVLSLGESSGLVLDLPSISSVAMKNVVGVPWSGAAVGIVMSGSAKLDFLERTAAAASATVGRIVGLIRCLPRIPADCVHA